MDTLTRLDRARQRHPDAPAPGSALEAEALSRFRGFFSHLAPDRVDALARDTYAEDVYFNDGLKAIDGLDALLPYLRESAEATDDCRVEILDVARSGSGEYYVRWSMMIRFKRFKRGEATWSVGTSHLRFDDRGRVVYHQDYWNAAEGLFEHVPLLGHAIRAIRRRL
jgi:hypothetical protein